MTRADFLALFPDEDACLGYLRARYWPDGAECPGCSKHSKFHRLAGRRAYSCQFCGHHVYPTVGTIFEKSTAGLHSWFWAVFLLVADRDLSVAELQRRIGVVYRTAARMRRRILERLDAGDEPVDFDPARRKAQHWLSRMPVREIEARIAEATSRDEREIWTLALSLREEVAAIYGLGA